MTRARILRLPEMETKYRKQKIRAIQAWPVCIPGMPVNWSVAGWKEVPFKPSMAGRWKNADED